jgi:hypothetical protein
MSPENKVLQLELKIEAMEFLEACRTRLAEIEAGLAGFQPLSDSWESYEYLSSIIATSPKVAENFRAMPGLRAKVTELETMLEGLNHG